MADIPWRSIAGRGLCSHILGVTPRLAVILNPRSGSAPGREELARALDAGGIAAEIHCVPPADVSPWLAGIANRYDTLVAAGGDGTVSTVAAVALRTAKTLGVIAGGTSNHFARDLGLPARLDATIGVLAASATSLLDVGLVNDRIFLNNASIGAYPHMVWQRTRARQRGLPRPLASSLAVIDTWLGLGAHHNSSLRGSAGAHSSKSVRCHRQRFVRSRRPSSWTTTNAHRGQVVTLRRSESRPGRRAGDAASCLSRQVEAPSEIRGVVWHDDYAGHVAAGDPRRPGRRDQPDRDTIEIQPDAEGSAHDRSTR